MCFYLLYTFTGGELLERREARVPDRRPRGPIGPGPMVQNPFARLPPPGQNVAFVRPNPPSEDVAAAYLQFQAQQLLLYNDREAILAAAAQIEAAQEQARLVAAGAGLQKQRGDGQERPKRRERAESDVGPSIPPGHLGPVRTPHPHDVLSGRGGRIKNHPGNVRFREAVEKLKPEYLNPRLKKLEKARFAARIVREVRGLNPPGRFLQVDPKTETWTEIGDEKAWKKAGQALREGGF